MRHCETRLCIYERDYQCILPDDLYLSSSGSCTCYCPIELQNNMLHAEKRRLLMEYETAEFMKEYDAKYPNPTQ